MYAGAAWVFSRRLWQSTIRLIVHSAQIGSIIQNAQRDDGKREDVRSRFEMASKRPVGSRQRHMRMDLAIDDIAVHADQVRGLRRVLDEHVLGWKVPIADLVYVVSADRTGAGKNHGVADLLLLHHLFHAGEQVHIVFEA